MFDTGWGESAITERYDSPALHHSAITVPWEKMLRPFNLRQQCRPTPSYHRLCMRAFYVCFFHDPMFHKIIRSIICVISDCRPICDSLMKSTVPHCYGVYFKWSRDQFNQFLQCTKFVCRNSSHENYIFENFPLSNFKLRKKQLKSRTFCYKSVWTDLSIQWMAFHHLLLIARDNRYLLWSIEDDFACIKSWS